MEAGVLRARFCNSLERNNRKIVVIIERIWKHINEPIEIRIQNPSNYLAVFSMLFHMIAIITLVIILISLLIFNRLKTVIALAIADWITIVIGNYFSTTYNSIGNFATLKKNLLNLNTYFFI